MQKIPYIKPQSTLHHLDVELLLTASREVNGTTPQGYDDLNYSGTEEEEHEVW